MITKKEVKKTVYFLPDGIQFENEYDAVVAEKEIVKKHVETIPEVWRSAVKDELNGFEKIVNNNPLKKDKQTNLAKVSAEEKEIRKINVKIALFNREKNKEIFKKFKMPKSSISEVKRDLQQKGFLDYCGMITALGCKERDELKAFLDSNSEKVQNEKVQNVDTQWKTLTSPKVKKFVSNDADSPKLKKVRGGYTKARKRNTVLREKCKKLKIKLNIKGKGWMQWIPIANVGKINKTEDQYIKNLKDTTKKFNMQNSKLISRIKRKVRKDFLKSIGVCTRCAEVYSMHTVWHIAKDKGILLPKGWEEDSCECPLCAMTRINKNRSLKDKVSEQVKQRAIRLGEIVAIWHHSSTEKEIGFPNIEEVKIGMENAKRSILLEIEEEISKK